MATMLYPYYFWKIHFSSRGRWLDYLWFLWFKGPLSSLVHDKWLLMGRTKLSWLLLSTPLSSHEIMEMTIYLISSIKNRICIIPNPRDSIDYSVGSSFNCIKFELHVAFRTFATNWLVVCKFKALCICFLFLQISLFNPNGIRMYVGRKMVWFYLSFRELFILFCHVVPLLNVVLLSILKLNI